MDGLMKLETIKRTPKQDTLDLKVALPTRQPTVGALQTADDALSILLSKPDYEALADCLFWLDSHTETVNLRIPGPKAAQIAKALVRDIVPDYWRTLSPNDGGTKRVRTKLIACLRTIVGIGALVLRLRELSAEASVEAQKEVIKDTIEVFEVTLRGSATVSGIARDVFRLIENPLSSQITWDTFVPYIAGSKASNAVAAAELRLRTSTDLKVESWVGDASAYTRWLGRNIRAFDADQYQKQQGAKAKAKLFTKAWFLGYRQELVQETFRGSLSGNITAVKQDTAFLQTLKPNEIQDVIFIMIQIESVDCARMSDGPFTGGFSALLREFSEKIPSVPRSLSWWLVNDPERRATIDIKIRRAAIAVLGDHPDVLEEACQALLKRLGDKLYIQNQPILQQETHMQDLLLLIGQQQHHDPEHIKRLARTGDYLNAISNRLGTSSQRARLLGMILGMAVSQLVDAPDKQLKFEDERGLPQELEWYANLTKIHDVVGSLSDLEACSKISEPKAKPKPVKAPAKGLREKNTKAPMIQEASSNDSSDESSDPDLPRYAKPDSDPSDSEDDPTLINRSQPKKPVYIRDLLRALRDDENFDRHRLALASAADLIRRKASFGAEVSDHAEDLASQLAGLRDTFSIDEFEEQRLRAMIALVVGRPAEMGKWFATAAFAGDHSVAQRASMLTALTLGARELAGFQREDAQLTGAHTAIEDMLPSQKRLPPQLEVVYGTQGYMASPASAQAALAAARPVSAAASQMQSTLLKPLAASAASTLAGPAAVQLRATSVTTKSKAPTAPVKRIDNKLARLLADSFFHPLATRFRLELAHSTRTPFATVPTLLAHFLKTLALLITAAGPNTLSLPGILAEMLSLVQWPPVRAAAAVHAPVREAVLLCLLATIDVASGGDGGMGTSGQSGRRTAVEAELVREHGTELLEAQAWCEAVFEMTPAGKGRDETETSIRQLAAGILVRIGEVVQRYQQEMMGDLARFS